MLILHEQERLAPEEQNVQYRSAASVTENGTVQAEGLESKPMEKC